MQYLFGINITDNIDNETMDGGALQTAQLPQQLQNALEAQAEAVQKAASGTQLPGWLRMVRNVCLVIGLICFSGIVRASVPLQVAYQNGPAFFWIGGITLAAAGLLTLWELYRKRNQRAAARNAAAEQEMARLTAQASAWLGVPEDAHRADILQFAYAYENGAFQPVELAELTEVRVFRDGASLRLSDGAHFYTLPLDARAELRIVEQPFALLSWNKTEPPNGERFRRAGVVTHSDELSGLRWCCALELHHGGEDYSLLFPAYELPAFAALTGLHTPALPAVPDPKHDDGPAGPIHPVFYWHPPKREIAHWFTLDADTEFRDAHPVAYVVLVLIGIVLLLGPAALFYFAVRNVPTVNDNYWALLGCAGGFVFGIALFNVLAAWMQQYFGHVVTIACITLGSIMMAASWLLI